MLDLLIHNGLVVFPDRVERADLAVQDGKIVEIAPELRDDCCEAAIDAAGLHVFPGLIDAHVHFNEPGRTEWEGFATGSAALAAGGGTMFFDMPLNSSPPVLDAASFDAKAAAARGKCHADYALWGGLTPRNLDRLEELAERGVVGFKAFMCDSGIDDFLCADPETLYHGMLRAAELNLPVAVHAEDQELTAKLTAEVRAAGKRSAADYLATRPAQAELNAIARAIELADVTGCRLHIVHVSTAAGIGLVRQAARRGVDVTAETCPHYLCLRNRDVEELGAPAKCAPPLRGAVEQQHLRESLAAGDINFVASDHSPAPAEMKQDSDFFNVWGGIAGVQSTLAVLLSLKPPLDPVLVARLVAAAPAERFGIPDKGRIELDCDADVVLVDLQREFTLRREDLRDRHKLSPYVGRTFRGVVRRTILRGQTVFADGQLTTAPPGRLIRPRR